MADPPENMHEMVEWTGVQNTWQRWAGIMAAAAQRLSGILK